MPEDNMLNRVTKPRLSTANTRSSRATKRQLARDTTRVERAFRRLLDGVERDPAIADLLSPRGDEGWH
jgi:hypothetical protein